MAQQLMSFTRQMMERVITDHTTRTDHDGHCCTLADEYAARLGKETTSSPAPAQPEVPATFEPVQTPKPPAQRKPRPAKQPEQEKQATDRQLDFILSLGRRVSINLISPSHRTMLQHVREGFRLNAAQASDLIEAMQAQTDQRPREASDRQIRYIHTLVKTREWNGTIDFENLTSAIASGLINDLKAAPRKAGADKEADIVHSSVSAEYPEEGFYFAEGTYYKVQDAKAQGGRRYAKRWNHDSEQWIYDGQRHFKLLTPETKLTAEQASRFGHLYGRCIARGCELTNEHSIELGYGPICAKNNGWPY
jgi:hypothetical protein